MSSTWQLSSTATNWTYPTSFPNHCRRTSWQSSPPRHWDFPEGIFPWRNCLSNGSLPGVTAAVPGVCWKRIFRNSGRIWMTSGGWSFMTTSICQFRQRWRDKVWRLFPRVWSGNTLRKARCLSIQLKGLLVSGHVLSSTIEGAVKIILYRILWNACMTFLRRGRYRIIPEVY